MTSESRKAAAYLESILSGIVKHPEALRVVVETDSRRVYLQPHPDPSDISRVYGKEWRTWAAIVQLIGAYTGCQGVKIILKNPPEPVRLSKQEHTNVRAEVATAAV